MTNEFAIKVLTELRGYGDKFANIGFDRKEALDLAIKALEQQPCEDCRSCKRWNECPCGKEGHENGTSIGYSIGECKDYEPSVPPKENDKLKYLKDRPCEVCEFHSDNGCNKWKCVFEEGTK